MKMTYTLAMASALLLAAGCAHEERTVRTNTTTDYSSGRISEYNNTYSSTPSVGGSYSADGSYSSGGGGAYATPGGNYSGTVGADGAYTPNTTSDSVASGYANVAGAESDELIVAQVRERLRQDPEIALIVPNLQISCHNGVIILGGAVQSEEQRRQILSRIQNVTGVVTVNNQMNVMAGPNDRNGQNHNGLTPTGNDSNSQPLYKDAASGPDRSSNNALNSTSRQNGKQEQTTP